MLWETQYQEFQSTPPWRGRPCSKRAFSVVNICFNPRPRGGGDDGVHQIGSTFIGFNPRPRGGGDGASSWRSWSYGRFQSTPPWRGRLRLLIKSLSDHRFNPRPRGGGDRRLSLPLELCAMFQSTPPWRGRLADFAVNAEFDVFQSTPPWRGRPKSFPFFVINPEFQSTPPWRGRQVRLQ